MSRIWLFNAKLLFDSCFQLPAKDYIYILDNVYSRQQGIHGLQLKSDEYDKPADSTGDPTPMISWGTVCHIVGDEA